MRHVHRRIGARRIGERRVAADRRRELPAVLRAGLRRFAARERIEHLLEGFRRQILIGVLADQDHRSIDAGSQALDLLPGEIAVGGDMERLVIDAPLAHLFDLLAAAQQARRRAAPLHMGLAADRLEQEHGVEGRDLEHADLRHAEQLGDAFDRLLRQPAAVLLLRPPQHRQHRGSGAAFRVVRDLALGPVEILRRKGKLLRLNVGGGEAADGHYRTQSGSFLRRAGRALISRPPTLRPDDGPSNARTGTAIPADRG